MPARCSLGILFSSSLICDRSPIDHRNLLPTLPSLCPIHPLPHPPQRASRKDAKAAKPIIRNTYERRGGFPTASTLRAKIPQIHAQSSSPARALAKEGRPQAIPTNPRPPGINPVALSPPPRPIHSTSRHGHSPSGPSSTWRAHPPPKIRVQRPPIHRAKRCTLFTPDCTLFTPDRTLFTPDRTLFRNPYKSLQINRQQAINHIFLKRTTLKPLGNVTREVHLQPRSDPNIAECKNNRSDPC